MVNMWLNKNITLNYFFQNLLKRMDYCKNRTCLIIGMESGGEGDSSGGGSLQCTGSAMYKHIMRD